MTRDVETSRPYTLTDFARARSGNRKIVMVTAYDHPTARCLDAAGIDCLLVGDSLGMVVHGKPDSLAVTVEDMIYHGKMVRAAAQRAMVVVDMPFMSYQISEEEALRNAGRILRETGAHAIKLEGGVTRAPTVARMVDAGIPVMGHVGLTPQSVRRLGGFKVQRDAEAILADAKALEEAGAFAIVIECVPEELGHRVTSAVGIPTIGIGAGPRCDGQVLVLHDLLGLDETVKPRFSRRYAELAGTIREAAKNFASDVRSGSFPGPEHGFQ
jgi:3-methyl-2-oxobutanoate hydroxymethyltransferase